MIKCKVCDREAIKKYCGIHQEVYNNIFQKFEAWKRADPLSWKEYLKELVKNSNTGTWTKEVANQLLMERDV